MKIVIGLLIVVGLVVGGILALPFSLISTGIKTDTKPLIEDALNRKIQLQDIRLTISALLVRTDSLATKRTFLAW